MSTGVSADRRTLAVRLLTPVGTAFSGDVLMVIAPKFMDPMFQNPPAVMGLPLGVIILGAGGLMMIIGFFLIRRIVDIEV